MIVKRKSVLSGITREMELNITQEQIDAHSKGASIQDVMQNLTDDEREFYLSGSTPEEWSKLAPDDN